MKRKRKTISRSEAASIRLARITAHAVMVLGDEAKATEWLRRPNRALNGEAPLRLLATEVGSRRVEDVLGRIEFGVVG